MSRQTATAGGWWRETIDSFAMALILAFMFRAFVAEAFVIPTGSMAPTLMGAHKDVACSQCGFEYQCGASNEFNSETGTGSNRTVVGTTCPLCRFEQPVDLANDANHATFSGDRILVSKLAYAAGDPQRWDVIVFKYPKEARQNYIKRLVGLPNETLRIRHGDVYVKAEGADEFSIARKPPNVVATLLQPVDDTAYRAAALTAAGLPSRWQSAGPVVTLGTDESAGDSDDASRRWTVVDEPERWTAEHASAQTADGELDWFRYYHYVLTPYQWSSVIVDGKLPSPVPPRSSRLITDFAHYNAETNAFRQAIYSPGGAVRSDYAPEHRSYGLGLGSNEPLHRDFLANDGAHWVGDLAAEFDLRWSGAGLFAVDLVEAGVHYTATFDPAADKVVLRAVEGGAALPVFEASEGGTAAAIEGRVDLAAEGSATIRFANVDDTLHLWVDGEYVELSPSNRVNAGAAYDPASHRPRYSPQDAADAAPVGLGVSPGLSCTVTRARVFRDVYYTAFGRQTYGGLLDYPDIFVALQRSVTGEAMEHYVESQLGGQMPSDWRRQYDQSTLLRDVLFSEPSLWSSAALFDARQTIEFPLGEKQYFPMGDNSTASADARSWLPEHFVHRDLMIGRAVMVFWPHPWNRPVPFLPNFERFGIIR